MYNLLPLVTFDMRDTVFGLWDINEYLSSLNETLMVYKYVLLSITLMTSEISAP